MSIIPDAARPTLPPAASRTALFEGSPRPLGAIPSELKPKGPQAALPPEESFRQHLQEAVQLNRERRDIYDRLSGGRSRSLSNRLILLERLTLPVASYLDRQAKRFQDRGIPILQQDFVSMQGVRSPFAPPRWKGVASDSQAEAIQAWFSDYRKTLSRALERNDFEAIAEASYDLLGRLEEAETRTQVHWAMSKHLIESLGLAAMNASGYAARSEGETLRLSRNFLKVQSLGLLGSVSVDRKAQGLHQLGIGIVVNDVPEIPFAARWEERSGAQ